MPDFLSLVPAVLAAALFCPHDDFSLHEDAESAAEFLQIRYIGAGYRPDRILR